MANSLLRVGDGSFRKIILLRDFARGRAQEKPAAPRLSKEPLRTAYTCGDLVEMDIRPTRFKGV
jgi:hypothetical protein